MYRIITIGGKVIGTTNSRVIAMMMASNFANTNCTFTKVYQANTLIAIYS